MEIKTYYQIEYTDNLDHTTVIRERVTNLCDFDKILDVLRRLRFNGKLHLVLYGYVVDEFSVVFEGTDKLLHDVRTEVI